MAIVTSSKVSTKLSPTQRFAPMSTPTASCSCLFPEFAASRLGILRQATLRRKDVHASQSRRCAVDDDYERHLLGLLGQHLQGCEELSLRAVLLGLRHRHSPDLADFRLHPGQHGQ